MQRKSATFESFLRLMTTSPTRDMGLLSHIPLALFSINSFHFNSISIRVSILKTYIISADHPQSGLSKPYPVRALLFQQPSISTLKPLLPNQIRMPSSYIAERQPFTPFGVVNSLNTLCLPTSNKTTCKIQGNFQLNKL